jgi:hypothetical protein
VAVELGQALAAYGDGMNEWDRQVFIAENGIDPVGEGSEAVSHCEWRPIEDAPKDGSRVVIWARWDWDGQDEDDCDDSFYAQVARYSKFYNCFISLSGNPYRDHAVNATHWAPIPPPPEE